MFTQNPKRLYLALVFCITIALALTTSSQAKAYAQPERRDHGALNRLIKKRSPGVVGPVLGVGANPPADSSTAAVPTTTTQAAATPDPPATSSPVAPVIKPNDPLAATSQSASPTDTSSTTSSVASTTSSSAASSTSSSSSTASTTLPTSSVIPTSDSNPNPLFLPTSSPTVVLVTSSVDAAPSAAASAVTQKNAAMQKTTTTVIIVVASSIVGTAIIWTVIRKWKFGKSDSFEDRMQPIDWQPTTEEDSGLPIHRRQSNASSFHSGGHGMEDNIAGHGGYGSTSDYGHGNAALGPLPDHDFTAAASNLAPVGGYADLARGPSPGPQMQELSGHGHYGTQDAYDYNTGARY